MKIKINQIDLFYQKSGSGRPIILLHGNRQSHKVFTSLTNILNKEFTVYSIDSRNHGQSSKTKTITYQEMADDIYQFIKILEIEKPILYGFSDGGIVGLLIAIHYPDILSSLIISGVNTTPNGIKKRWLMLYRTAYFLTKSPIIKLMIKETNITLDLLKTINISVYLTAGEYDVIKYSHIKKIQENIKNSKLEVFKKATHSSYILKRNELGQYILNLLK